MLLFSQERILNNLSLEMETTSNRLDFVQKRVAMVMKKAGIISGDAPPPEVAPAALECYRAIFKQPLPDNFIEAIESLLEVTSKKKKGGGGAPGQVQPIPV